MLPSQHLPSRYPSSILPLAFSPCRKPRRPHRKKVKVLKSDSALRAYNGTISCAQRYTDQHRVRSKMCICTHYGESRFYIHTFIIHAESESQRRRAADFSSATVQGDRGERGPELRRSESESHGRPTRSTTYTYTCTRIHTRVCRIRVSGCASIAASPIAQGVPTVHFTGSLSMQQTHVGYVVLAKFVKGCVARQKKNCRKNCD